MTTKLNVRVLAVFGIVSLPLLVVATLLTVGAGRSDLRESHGRQLAQIAEHIASATDAVVYRLIINASVIGRAPSLRDAAVAGNRIASDEASTRALDESWRRGPGVPRPLDGLLTNASSRFLNELTSQDPIYRELLLTDRVGRLIAASERTSDYFQADEDWWTAAFGDGVRGRLFVSGVRYDESAQSDAIEIAVPITTGDSVVGVVKAIADIRELTALVGGMRVGATGDARLVRPDGTLVFRRAAATDPPVDFFASDLLRQRLEDSPREGPGALYRLSFSAPARDGGRRLVGVASSQIGASYPNLDWLVAVSQEESELFAPIDAQARWLLLMLATAGLVMILLAILFSRRLAASPIADDIHLSTHPKIMRTDEPE
jgi:hypothetical protein